MGKPILGYLSKKPFYRLYTKHRYKFQSFSSKIFIKNAPSIRLLQIRRLQHKRAVLLLDDVAACIGAGRR